MSQTYEGETAFKSKHTNRKWVLVKNHKNPRKREWALYSNGKVIRRKKGAITLGGNIGTTIQRTFSKTDYQNKPKLKVGDRKQYQDLQKAKKDTFGKKDKTSKKPLSEEERLLKSAKENLANKKKTPITSDKPKKRMTAREKLRAKNVERFGQKHVDHLRAKHADFKKMKKREISKEAFIDKYPKSQTAKRFKKSRR